VGHALI
jgi:pyridoxamine 5'-phosphate oxidase